MTNTNLNKINLEFNTIYFAQEECFGSYCNMSKYSPLKKCRYK